MITRYSSNISDEFEPGSNERVLKNMLGIIFPVKMNELQTEAFARVESELANQYDFDHAFSSEDIKSIHRKVFGKIFAWAGDYRDVELATADGLPFLKRNM